MLGILTVAGGRGFVLRILDSWPRRERTWLKPFRSPRRGDAFWLGILLTVIGFCLLTRLELFLLPALLRSATDV